MPPKGEFISKTGGVAIDPETGLVLIATDKHVYCLFDSGEKASQLWVTKVEEDFNQPVVANIKDAFFVFATTRSGKLFQFSGKNGRELSGKTIGSGSLQPPTVDLSLGHGMVFVSDVDSVVAVNDNLNEKWTFQPKGMYVKTRVVESGSKVFFIAGANNKYQLFGLDALTGENLAWSPTPVESYSVDLALANNVLYYGSGSSVYAIDAGTGKQKASYTDNTRKPSFTGPTVANGVVYVWSKNTEALYTLDAGTLNLLGKAQLKAPAQELLAYSPVVANGVVYIIAAYSSGKGWSMRLV